MAEGGEWGEEPAADTDMGVAGEGVRRKSKVALDEVEVGDAGETDMGDSDDLGLDASDTDMGGDEPQMDLGLKDQSKAGPRQETGDLGLED